LLLAYALGAATSLALALLLGGKAFAAMKRSLGISEWIRRGLGVLVLASVLVIALGLDTSVLSNASLTSTTSLEQGLVDRLRPQTVMVGNSAINANPKSAEALPVEGSLPPLTGAAQWLNSTPLMPESLREKVVLIDFWTYSCINCLREVPYIRAWAAKYKDQGLVVIGVHSPEFAFEKNIDNVKKAVSGLGISYPVAVDNDYAIWQSFANEYGPALYFIEPRVGYATTISEKVITRNWRRRFSDC
jgi:thiol-disulfide isomerase/thioredoxin